MSCTVRGSTQHWSTIDENVATSSAVVAPLLQSSSGVSSILLHHLREKRKCYTDTHVRDITSHRQDTVRQVAPHRCLAIAPRRSSQREVTCTLELRPNYSIRQCLLCKAELDPLFHEGRKHGKASQCDLRCLALFQC